MELPNSTLPPKKKPIYATKSQKEYINDMLDEIGSDLSEYTDKDLDDLTIAEACEIIPELQDAVDEYRHGRY